MQVKVIKATKTQKLLIANLLELYTYDFTEFSDFEIGEDGRYGYKHLELYWSDSKRFPYLIFVDNKVAGFILLQKCTSALNNRLVWDITEFFILKSYRRKHIGTIAAHLLWEQHPGDFQVRVISTNSTARHFWRKAIEDFTHIKPIESINTIDGKQWHIYSFVA